MLWDHQQEALEKLSNGKVLVGGTGSGKTRTALAYYNKVLGAAKSKPEALYVITTAKKRDDADWQEEAQEMGISSVVVDSWNNIKKYTKVANAMFIFDEQRVIGYGAWTKSFLKIARFNRWILLSATPADSWLDLIPVFIANGFFRNKTEFLRQHVIFSPYTTFPKVTGYRDEALLEQYKNAVFVVMSAEKRTRRHIVTIPVQYNKLVYDSVVNDQWHPTKDRPIDTLSEEVHVLRELLSAHVSRIEAAITVWEKVQRLIIFYNYNSELDLLKLWFDTRTTVAEYNGHRHDPLPDTPTWVYLVQYTSGSEAWECFTTNHILFFSLNYSYRTMEQARGRIDRHNTAFEDLYYYELVSSAPLDQAVLKAIRNKKNFNIRMLRSKSRESQRS